MEEIVLIEKWFIQNNNDVAKPSLDGHLKLQKLLFYSQAMTLSVLGDPLFSNDFEAWPNGPVVPKAYVDYRHHDIVNRTPKIQEENISLSLQDNVKSILNVINHIYGNQSAEELVKLTHNEDPWAELKTAALRKKNPIITKKRIKEYYRDLKDIFDMYEGYDFETKTSIVINGNTFVYDTTETTLTDEDQLSLWNVGSEVSNKKYFVYKYDDELVIY